MSKRVCDGDDDDISNGSKDNKVRKISFQHEEYLSGPDLVTTSQLKASKPAFLGEKITSSCIVNPEEDKVKDEEQESRLDSLQDVISDPLGRVSRLDQVNPNDNAAIHNAAVGYIY